MPASGPLKPRKGIVRARARAAQPESAGRAARGPGRAGAKAGAGAAPGLEQQRKRADKANELAQVYQQGRDAALDELRAIRPQRGHGLER